ncbi:MAG: hypothetical protein RL685_3567 [Pseudomonadota bacterium]|jgi:hypothetical protein
MAHSFSVDVRLPAAPAHATRDGKHYAAGCLEGVVRRQRRDPLAHKTEPAPPKGAPVLYFALAGTFSGVWLGDAAG